MALCDTRSNTLSRYGRVHPQLAETLDPHLDRLAEMALALAAVVTDQPAKDRRDQVSPEIAD